MRTELDIQNSERSVSDTASHPVSIAIQPHDHASDAPFPRTLQAKIFASPVSACGEARPRLSRADGSQTKRPLTFVNMAERAWPAPVTARMDPAEEPPQIDVHPLILKRVRASLAHGLNATRRPAFPRASGTILGGSRALDRSCAPLLPSHFLPSSRLQRERRLVTRRRGKSSQPLAALAFYINPNHS